MFTKQRLRFWDSLDWWTFNHALRYYLIWLILVPVWITLRFTVIHSTVLFVGGFMVILLLAALCGVMVILGSIRSKVASRRFNGVFGGAVLVLFPVMAFISYFVLN